MPKIKKGDLVQVITGAKQDRGGDRGKQGKVLSVDFVKNRVIVEGVNMVTRHNKIGQTERAPRPAVSKLWKLEFTFPMWL